MFKYLILVAGLTLLLFSKNAYGQSVLKGYDSYQPIDVSSESFQLEEKKNRALLKGNVKVIQGDLNFFADNLTIFYEKDKGQTNPQINRFDALGAVTLKSPSETITSNWAIYDIQASLITFGGNVSILQDGNSLEGDRLELDLQTGLAKMDGSLANQGRVQGRFSAPEKPQY